MKQIPEIAIQHTAPNPTALSPLYVGGGSLCYEPKTPRFCLGAELKLTIRHLDHSITIDLSVEFLDDNGDRFLRLLHDAVISLSAYASEQDFATRCTELDACLTVKEKIDNSSYCTGLFEFATSASISHVMDKIQVETTVKAAFMRLFSRVHFNLLSRTGVDR